MSELLSGISGEELNEWMAFERIEPFGALMQQQMFGMVCATIANVMGANKSKPSDFMGALARELKPRADPVGADLTDEQHQDLLDAELFGVVRAKSK